MENGKGADGRVDREEAHRRQSLGKACGMTNSTVHHIPNHLFL